MPPDKVLHSADTAAVGGGITSGGLDALSPADHLPADELEDPGGMTWREVKDFLDHIRTTCMDERTALKLEVRQLRAENVKLLKFVIQKCPRCGTVVAPDLDRSSAGEDLGDGGVGEPSGLSDGSQC